MKDKYSTTKRLAGELTFLLVIAICMGFVMSDLIVGNVNLIFILIMGVLVVCNILAFYALAKSMLDFQRSVGEHKVLEELWEAQQQGELRRKIEREEEDGLDEA